MKIVVYCEQFFVTGDLKAVGILFRLCLYVLDGPEEPNFACIEYEVYIVIKFNTG